MKVSVIIPNYNGIKFLEDCLDSLRIQSFKDFEIIMVDNDSKDDSVNFVKQNYPEVIILKQDKNFGFSKAVNEGIKYSKSDYVLLLNNDTKCTENYIENLVKALDRNTKAFSVASKMVQMYKPDLLDSAGDLYTVLGWAINLGVGRSANLFNKKRKVFTACAGAAIYRREVFEKIGYFDEMHFAYLEDIDIGYRARIYGYENYYEPSAVVYHVGSGTSGSKYNSFKVKLSSRNSIYLNYKNMPNIQLVINFLPLLFGYIVKYIFFIKKGFGKDYLSGIKEGLQTRKKCKRSVNGKFINYLKIELSLIKYTFSYVLDWVKRKTSPKK